MNINELKEAIEDAEKTCKLLEYQTSTLSKLLVGKLRCVTRFNNWHDHETLCKLKRELTQYNASTREWKS